MYVHFKLRNLECTYIPGCATQNERTFEVVGQEMKKYKISQKPKFWPWDTTTLNVRSFWVVFKV